MYVIYNCLITNLFYFCQVPVTKVEGDEISTYDSNDDSVSNDDDSDSVTTDGEDERNLDDTGDVEKHGQSIPPHDSPNSYAWLLIRLATTWHIYYQLQNLVKLAGFDLSGTFLFIMGEHFYLISFRYLNGFSQIRWNFSDS